MSGAWKAVLVIATSVGAMLWLSRQHSVQGRQDNAPAFVYFLPCQCTVLKTNSSSFSSQHTIWPPGSLKLCSLVSDP